MRIETVKIQAANEQGFIIINKCDLKQGQKLYDDKPTAQVKTVKPVKGRARS